MDKVLRPSKLDISPDAPKATRHYLHWLQTFENFVAAIKLPQSYEDRITEALPREDLVDEFKKVTLTNFVSPDIWMDIESARTYAASKLILDNLFIKKPSEPYARYKLQSAKQEDGQSLEAFRRLLDRLSRECNFTDVDAVRYRQDMVLQAFIAGIRSNDIRKRLLAGGKATYVRGRFQVGSFQA